LSTKKNKFKIIDIESNYKITRFQNIFLIGEVKLNEKEIEILNQGLKFTPKSNYNSKIPIGELNSQSKKIDKAIYEAKNPNQYLKPFQIPKYSQNILEENFKYIEKLQKGSNKKQNNKCLLNLKNRKDITIKPADKNIGISIFNTKTYIEIIENNLKDKITYKQLEGNPLENCCKKLKALLINLLNKEKINTKDHNRMIPKEPRIGLFYGLPKLHKKVFSIRPIVSQINHPTRQINKFLHEQLQEINTKAYTALPNSYKLTEILSQIEYDSNIVMISFDIVNLYTNIPTKFGINNILEIYQGKEKNIDSLTLNILLHNVLSQNIFEFNRKYYTQIQGTAMGSCLAPTYAGCVLRNLEEKWLKTTTFIKYIILFKRYVDDILILYNNKDKNIEEFIKEFQEVYKPLKLTNEINKNNINFLDITIELNHLERKIEHKLYKKEIGQTEIIDITSNHPTNVLYSTLQGESLRASRLNSNPINTKMEQQILLNKALKKGYSKKKARKAIYKNFDIKNQKDNEPINTISLTYQGTNTMAIKHNLQAHLREKHPHARLRIAYKTEKNLKRLLTKPSI